MIAERQFFPTPAVVSAITGRLICDISQVHEVLTFAAGEPVWTHQLPRVGRELAAAMLALHPDLAVLVEEAKEVTRETWQAWRDDVVARFGARLQVPRLSADQHERIDPLSELSEAGVHPSRIVTVSPP